ncbi:phosphatase PAP2 family protein [bacterium]|nr:phosphatase PAP2 family protein [bacterium]
MEPWDLGAWDLWLFRRINGDWTGAALDAIAKGMQPALPGIILGAIVAYWLYRRHGKSAIGVIVACVVAVAVADVLAAQFIKPLVARPRPTVALEGVRMLVGKKSGFGFPSNHATNIAAVCWILGLSMRRYGWLMFAPAFIVGYSRVYVGVHYPSDVAGGYLLGTVVAVSVWLIYQELAFLLFPDKGKGAPDQGEAPGEASSSSTGRK